MKYTIIFSITITVVVILCVCALIQEIRSRFPNHSNIAVALATLGLVAAAIYGFYSTKQATRMQTSMDFCTYVYPILQSPEFVQREQYLKEALTTYSTTASPCSFYDIKDEKLRTEIVQYCECLNGIGVLVHEHMIEPAVIVPYIGTNTTILYDLIKPYLDSTRVEQSNISHAFASEYSNQIVNDAKMLYFVHYELLALMIRAEGPKYTKDLKRELDDLLKRKK